MQVKTIKSTDNNTGHILMTDLFSGFTLGATPLIMDPYTVIDTFFSHWVVGQPGWRPTGGNDLIPAHTL